MGLNCVCPPTMRCFSIVNATVLHDSQLAEPVDTEYCIQRNLCRRADYKLYADFSSVQRVGASMPHVIQGSTVPVFRKMYCKVVILEVGFTCFLVLNSFSNDPQPSHWLGWVAPEREVPGYLNLALLPAVSYFQIPEEMLQGLTKSSHDY